MSNLSMLNSLSEAIDKIIIGQSHIVKQLLVALLSSGHVIIEGVPGTGKTLLVKVLSRLITADFRRIQLTPDILPSDILGTNIFDLNSRDFILKKGPIFTEILLADEINRTPPKTQAALLEAMEEQQVTLDGDTIALSPLFWVVATQNSLEFEGTYPLPEAQLDRFLFKLLIDYPHKEAEKEILQNVQAGFKARKVDLDKIQSIATVEDILTLRQQVQNVEVQENILDYLLNLVERTRQHPDLVLGASPRATLAWLQAAKANACLGGRNYVIPDDVKEVAAPLLRHRLILKPEAQLDNVRVDFVIESILKQISVPR
ncbi:MAG: MoxR family ATPase [Xenococcaceae cyanobacterium MO_188.B32]|nr:MoxR family ATPase [Xenococcaceae cyanobacterium MO_188.B32]